MVINYHQYNNDGNRTLIDQLFFVLDIQDGVQDGCCRILRFRIACEFVNLAHLFVIYPSN